MLRSFKSSGFIPEGVAEPLEIINIQHEKLFYFKHNNFVFRSFFVLRKLG